jgi:hypothetical protein
VGNAEALGAFLFTGFVTLHILYHAAREPACGVLVPELHANPALDHQVQLVLLVVMMPDERALKLVQLRADRLPRGK